jgi:hypothetical protein
MFKQPLKIMLVLFTLSGLLSACGYTFKNEEDHVKYTIEKFYNVQYKAYLKMEYIDTTPYLDMTKIQNQNKVIALKELTFRRKYAFEKGYGYVERRRFPLKFNYKNIDINGNRAKVVVELEIDRTKAYPMFICPGDNIFELEKQDGHWKIINHTYQGLTQYELWIDKKLPEPDYEKIKRQLDKEFGETNGTVYIGSMDSYFYAIGR